MKNTYSLREGRASASLLPDPSGHGPCIITEIHVLPAVQGNGWGTEVLRQVCAAADAENVQLMLSVDPGPTGLSYQELCNWYSRHGFLALDNGVMVRFPQDSV